MGHHPHGGQRQPHVAVDLQKKAVYGLTEHYREAIRTAPVVACPGCSAIPSEPWLIGNLRVTDGRLDFTARAPASGGEALDVVLFPGRQNLDGSYRPAGAMEVTGLVKLTLANDQVIPF